VITASKAAVSAIGLVTVHQERIIRRKRGQCLKTWWPVY
jgi:hypothetical protein